MHIKSLVHELERVASATAANYPLALEQRGEPDQAFTALIAALGTDDDDVRQWITVCLHQQSHQLDLSRCQDILADYLRERCQQVADGDLAAILYLNRLLTSVQQTETLAWVVSLLQQELSQHSAAIAQLLKLLQRRVKFPPRSALLSLLELVATHEPGSPLATSLDMMVRSSPADQRAIARFVIAIQQRHSSIIDRLVRLLGMTPDGDLLWCVGQLLADLAHEDWTIDALIQAAPQLLRLLDRRSEPVVYFAIEQVFITLNAHKCLPVHTLVESLRYLHSTTALSFVERLLQPIEQGVNDAAHLIIQQLGLNSSAHFIMLSLLHHWLQQHPPLRAELRWLLQTCDDELLQWYLFHLLQQLPQPDAISSQANADPLDNLTDLKSYLDRLQPGDEAAIAWVTQQVTVVANRLERTYLWRPVISMADWERVAADKQRLEWLAFRLVELAPVTDRRAATGLIAVLAHPSRAAVQQRAIQQLGEMNGCDRTIRLTLINLLATTSYETTQQQAIKSLYRLSQRYCQDVVQELLHRIETTTHPDRRLACMGGLAALAQRPPVLLEILRSLAVMPQRIRRRILLHLQWPDSFPLTMQAALLDLLHSTESPDVYDFISTHLPLSSRSNAPALSAPS